MLNHITIMGRLTRDPELRYTQSQTPVAWRSTAEFVSKYFAKGSMAVVSGRLQIRDWTDREGGKRRSAEVVVDNMYFGESKRREGGDMRGEPRHSSSYDAPAPSMGASAFSELGDDDGELPF